MKKRLFVIGQLVPLLAASVLCMAGAQSPVLSGWGISPLTLAIVAGMLLGNTLLLRMPDLWARGIAFGKTWLLQVGIMLYGFRLTLSQVAYVGWPALLLALPACTGGTDGRANGRRFAVPWFVPAFLVMVVVNSWFPPPPHIYRAVLTLDTLLLTTAMFSLGLTTRWQAVRAAGVKPLLLAGILAVWLMIGGGVLSYAGYWLFK